jgi:hypothetical protein
MNFLETFIIKTVMAQPVTLLPSEASGGKYQELVGKIKTGEIELSDLPLFALYFIEIAVVAAGMIAFIMIIYGGYQYVVGGVVSEMKEKGKTTLSYAIGGLVVSLLSYAIVSLIQLAATSSL